MHKKLLWSLLLLFVALTPVQAQEQDEQDNTQQTAQTENEETQQDSEPLPDIDNQPIQPGSGGVGRFIPSEQISQDSGVSFPVDI